MTASAAPAAEAAPGVDLRCHRCSYFIRRAPHADAAELVAIYKPGRGARVYAPQPLRSERCGHCGWVNVFVLTLVALGLARRG